MTKMSTAIVINQTPLGGPHRIGIHASLHTRLKLEGECMITLVRGIVRKKLKVELLSLEQDRGKEIRISPKHLRRFGLSGGEKVVLDYHKKTKKLYIREAACK